MSGWREQMSADIQRNKSAVGSKTGGSVRDEREFKALMSGARTKPGGILFSNVMLMKNPSTVCRYPISGSGETMYVCGDPVDPSSRKSYCVSCCEKAYYTPSRRVDNAAVKAGEIGSRHVEQKPEPVTDLFGEVVAEEV